MAITKPYRRTARPFVGGDYSSGGTWAYVMHPKFAVDPHHYVRAFLVLQKDLLELFDYIEPADKNLPAYSFRVHELLLRVCVEIEANCKAVLRENGYTKQGIWNITDYRKVESSHLLSRFEIKFPTWHGASGVRCPFNAWSAGQSTAWYDAYNEAKHNRHAGFENANFQHLTDAFCGLVALLSAQFWTHDYVPESNIVGVMGPGDGFDAALGSYFRVKFPTNIADTHRYSFNWEAMKNDPDPFQNFAY